MSFQLRIFFYRYLCAHANRFILDLRFRRTAYPLANHRIRDQLAQMYNQIWGDAFDIQTYEAGSKHKLSARNLIATQFPNHALQFSAHGKPLLSPATAQINHSHAGDYSVFIHHQSQSVGVDIEQIRPQLRRIYQRFCNDYELNWLGENPSLDALLLVWCAKEALYKAIGQKGTDFRIHLQIEPIALQPEISWPIPRKPKQFSERNTQSRNRHRPFGYPRNHPRRNPSAWI